MLDRARVGAVQVERLCPFRVVPSGWAGDKPVFDDGFLKSVGAWLRNNVLAIAIAVTAAVPAFIASYWRNPAWGAKAPEDWLAVLGAVFAAFVTGLTAGSATQPKAKASGEQTRPPEPGQSTPGASTS